MRFQQLIAPALVRLTNPEDFTLGTGFVAGPDGQILTCHHVVAGKDQVNVHFANGMAFPVGLEGICLLPDVDLAILQVPGCNVSPLPLVQDANRLTRFWSKGFQWQGRGLLDAFPIEGCVAGETEITYIKNEFRYTVRRALVLNPEGSKIDRGMSGAPLLDPTSGVVCGVIVAEFSEGGSAFALFFPYAAAVEPCLLELLDSNDRNVARFGRHVNALGASALCREQIKHAIQHLGHLYLPDRYCPRDGIDKAVEAFAGDPARVLPIVGLAGVGKTNVVTRLAEHLSGVDQAALLLRGLDVSGASIGLVDLASEAVGKADLDAWQDKATIVDLVAALDRDGKTLWLLLDGLNEARASLHDLIDIWVPNTSSWLSNRPVKLILTCRIEQWRLLVGAFPADILFQQRHQNSERPSNMREFLLEDYSASEARRAAEKYGIDLSESEDFMRHPLTLRLVWELRTGGDLRIGQPERSEDIGVVIDRFVDRACARVATRGATLAARVRSTVDVLAKSMFGLRKYEVSFADADALPASSARWLDALTDERLLSATSTGYRFAFDEISDYLQSFNVDPAQLERFEKIVADLAVPLPVLVHVFGRLAAKGPKEALEKANTALCRWLEQSRWQEGVFFAFQVARRLASRGAERRLIESLIQSSLTVDGEITADLFKRDARRLALPAAALMRLVRLMLPKDEAWYGWREKDWRDARRRRTEEAVFASDFSLSSTVGIALQEDGPLTIRILIDWIDDGTPLHGRSPEASVGDFAIACLFYARRLYLREIVEGIVDSQVRGAVPLLQVFAEEEPMVMAEMVAPWIDRSKRRELAAEILLHLFYRFSDAPEVRRQVVPSLMRLDEVAEDGPARHAVIRALAYESECAEIAWSKLRLAYLAGAPTLSAWSFHPFLNNRFDDVIIVLRERLHLSETGFDDYDIADVTGFLGNYSTGLHQTRATTDLLNDVLAKAGTTTVARALEDILYRVDSETARLAGALDLAQVLLKVDPEEAVCLLYVAFPPAEDYPSSAALRNILIGVANRKWVPRIVALVAESITQRNLEAWQWLRPFRPLLSREEWEGVLLHQIVMDHGAFATFVEYEWGAQGWNLGEKARAYLEARRQGASSQNAALSAAELSIDD